MIRTERTVYIVNPVAGKGKSLRIWALLEPLLRKRGEAIECRVTPGPNSVSQVARQAFEEGYDRIVAVGGDGTVQEVANGIAGTDCEFGIVPAGTGNDFAKTLDLPKGLEALANVLIGDHSIRVDLGRMNGDFFVNIAGAGIDAVIADRVNRGPVYINGTVTYLVTAIPTLLSYRSPRMRVCIDGNVIEDEMLLVAVGNGQYYGGGVKMVPDARVDDGIFHIVIVSGVGRWEAMRLLPLTYSGRHMEYRKCAVYSGTEVRIDSETLTPVQADGNIVGVLPAVFTVAPSALRVLVPRGRER
ncbi:MAG: diacylglycerol kinase family lipid kinase [Firmicutes bacterium]|nr:diacylglycerol kinase family lipid kinase [Bacillota bacterium]